MKLLIFLAIIIFIWIAFDLIWSLLTLAFFGLLILVVAYIGIKLIRGRW